MTEAKAKTTVSTGNQLGTFGGVFTPTILTILGVIMFMRSNFVVGEAGVFGAILILLLAKSITFLTSLSISAIATNMQVRGGGSYFLISRVLGPEFGGAIGLSLYIATALSAPFYVIGFIEALTLTFPSLEPWAMWISIVMAVLISIVAYVGADWAIKVQYVIMTVLALSIAVFMAGAITNFSPELLSQNWKAGFTFMDIGTDQGNRYSFWLVFAIFFPAVTGIDAGLNMSGDLKNPTKSLPLGTLIAVLVGLGVYAGQIVLSGGAYAREELINNPFQLLVDNAIFGLGFIVVAGVFAATLSSALGSTLGAPRVLQALARDPILQILKPFAKGTEVNDEPQRALFFTSVITIAVLCWSFMSSGGDALNAIAAIITMFFLYTYGMINLAAFTEAFGKNPSFRPRFKFFHWITALLGGLGCIFAAFLINPVAAAIAAVLIVGLILYLRTKQTEASFGDARRGFVYSSARKSLIQLAEMKEDAKNWRPTMLVFSGNPHNREALVSYAVWLSSGRGILLLADILAGQPDELTSHRKMAIKRLNEFCEEKNIHAFPMAIAGETIERGMMSALQLAGSGVIRPNVAVYGWSDDIKGLGNFVKQLREAKELQMSLLVIRGETLPKPNKRKHVHIWWRGSDNGHLMMIFGFLLKDNWEWGKSQITVLRAVDEEAGVEPALQNLNEMIDDARIDATAHVVLKADNFKETLYQESKYADCVFLGFDVPEEDNAEKWYNAYSAMLKDMPTTILVNSSIDENLLD